MELSQGQIQKKVDHFLGRENNFTYSTKSGIKISEHNEIKELFIVKFPDGKFYAINSTRELITIRYPFSL